MTSILIYGFLGLLSGLHFSCLGGYKDSAYEKFEISKFLRSSIIGFLLGIVLSQILVASGFISLNLGMFFVFIVAFERLITESLKAFVREEKQEKYKIPSKFHIFGKVVNHRLLRLTIGLLIIPLPFLLFYLPVHFPIEFHSKIFVGFIWGLVAGLASAIAGAWKDAPIESFYPLKFLRSPIISSIWGVIFSFLTDNYAFLLISCIGAERKTVEFYKTFLTKKVPGKFKADKPLFIEWIEKRKVFVFPYAVTWTVYLGLLII